MLAYFPPLRPGELVYSGLARLAEDMGIRTRQGLEGLVFGAKKTAPASATIPIQLARVASMMPGLKSNGVTLAMEHTLYPYYASTVSQALASRLLTAMIHGGGTAFIGAVARKIVRPRFLRFCPECLSAMASGDRQGHWARGHQLESSLVCAQHGCDLLPSRIALGAPKSYATASASTCPTSPSPLPKLREAERGRLILLAGWGERLLNGHGNEMGLALPDVSALMERKGIVVGARCSRQRIRDAFVDSFDFLRPVWPSLFQSPDRENCWFDVFLAKDKFNIHPMAALLLKIALETLDDASPQEPPFGYGPWTCENPVADHYGQKVVTELKRRRTSHGILGEFTCRCGDTYARTLDRSGKIGGLSRRFGRGNTLDEFVTRSIAGGQTLGWVAEKAKTEPEVIRAVADRLGHVNAWQRRSPPSRSCKRPAKPATKR